MKKYQVISVDDEKYPYYHAYIQLEDGSFYEISKDGGLASLQEMGIEYIYYEGDSVNMDAKPFPSAWKSLEEYLENKNGK